MRRKTIPVVFAITFGLSACTSHAEKLCTSQFSKELLNPETAQYNDFHTITSQDIDGDPTYASLKTKLADSVAVDGASFYQMRVRAEGEMGNKVTKIEFCAIPTNKDDCACTEIDDK